VRRFDACIWYIEFVSDLFDWPIPRVLPADVARARTHAISGLPNVERSTVDDTLD
jgi:hypothetical protein